MNKRQVADRYFMGFVLYLLIGLSFGETYCVNFGAVPVDSIAATLSKVVLAILTTFAMFDTFVNDTLGNKHSVRISLHTRQMNWMLIGVTLMGWAFVDFRVTSDFWSGVWLAAFGVRSISIAFLDLHYERLSRKEQIECVISSKQSI